MRRFATIAALAALVTGAEWFVWTASAEAG